MFYMGSKAKYAKYIVPILQDCIDNNNVTLYIEPFVGGANIIDKIKCENRYGFDRSDTLIALLQTAANNFDNVMKDGNRELWDKGKAYVKDKIRPEDMTLAEIGAIEFLASYSNGGFPRGYAKNTSTRNYYKEAYRNLEKQAPNLKNIQFKCASYETIPTEDLNGAVIYCDPPYQGTHFYGYANQPRMNYEHFWDWVRQLSEKNFVFVSEQSAPYDFKTIWTQEVKRTAGKENNFKAVEHLFVYNK